jgi:hypothetical protein
MFSSFGYDRWMDTAFPVQDRQSKKKMDESKLKRNLVFGLKRNTYY